MRMNRRAFLLTAGALGYAGLVHAQSTGGFTFAAVNDLHLLDEASAAALGKAVDAINAQQDAAFTVVLGDLSSNAQAQEFALAKTALDRLARPHYLIPGNHDMNNKDKANPAGSFEAVFGPANWRRDVQDWTLIGLNSCDGVKSDVALSEERLAWLKAQVAEIPAERPIALFLHHPLNPHSKSYRVKNADAVLALFAGHNLKLAAAGHFHGNQVEEQNGVLFTTTACCSSTRGDHDGTKAKGFRLFHCQNGKVQTEFVEVDV